MSNSVPVGAGDNSALVARVRALELRADKQDDAIQELMIKTGIAVYDSSSESSEGDAQVPSLVTRDIRDVLRSVDQLTFQRKYQDIQRVIQEALQKNSLNDESKGVLHHKLAWALYNQKDVRAAKAEVLKAFQLNLSEDLRKRFNPLRRKIDEMDALKASPKAARVKPKPTASTVSSSSSAQSKKRKRSAKAEKA